MTSAFVAFLHASGLVDTAGESEVSPSAVFERNMDWIQAFRTSVSLAFAASSWLAVHRPLECLNAYGVWRGGRVRLIAHDSKSCRGNTLVGSNPTLSVPTTS